MKLRSEKKQEGRNSNYHFSLREVCLEWLFFSTFSAGIMFSILWIGQFEIAKTVVVGASILVIATIPTYSFIIQPMLNFLIYKESLKCTPETAALEKWIYEEYGVHIKVRLIDKQVINAYATGVIPFSKLILLGKPLIEKMSKEDIQGLVLHELGHTVRHHLLVLYCINVLSCAIGAYVYYKLMPLYKTMPFTGVFIFFHGALSYLVFVAAMPGVVQRYIEYAADRFAAQRIGSKSYATTLENLNALTHGDLNKWAFNYPSLKKRLTKVYEVEPT